VKIILKMNSWKRKLSNKRKFRRLKFINMDEKRKKKVSYRMKNHTMMKKLNFLKL
jgi:hypothetical protein